MKAKKGKRTKKVTNRKQKDGSFKPKSINYHIKWSTLHPQRAKVVRLEKNTRIHFARVQRGIM